MASSSIYTIAFWQGAGERALKTFIQTGVAAFAASVVGKTTVWDIPWGTAGLSILGVSLLAAILSLVTSLGNADFTSGAPAVEAPAAPVADPAPTPAPVPAQAAPAVSSGAPMTVTDQPSPTFAA